MTQLAGFVYITKQLILTEAAHTHSQTRNGIKMDWNSVLKPFQANSISFGTANQSDLLNLAKTIIKK